MLSPERQSARLNPVCDRMHFSCTRIATVCFKGLMKMWLQSNRLFYTAGCNVSVLSA